MVRLYRVEIMGVMCMCAIAILDQEGVSGLMLEFSCCEGAGS